VLPPSTVPKDRPLRIKTGLTIATARILPDIMICHRCNMLGHNAARCTAMSLDKGLYRRCRDRDHTIKQSTKESRCIVCANENRSNLRHVAGSQACLVVKDGRGNDIVRAR
jgi:hypothetical protein